uniref:E3 ubiquitin-protein ligase listerin n=1 Tax=Globisporangium ultimum (strain ATCC 200006 / CBS 805.95 / DAOM BR144) TaxID=431595 RepID=K3WIF3_GLOUD
MAPKKNKQRERQEQSKAASSARAQEQLLSSFSAAPAGFIGFGSFATSATPAAASSKANAYYGGGEGKNAIVQTIYDGADPDITMALKMLGKKGSVTKIKALNSFLVEILPPKKPIEIRSMLGPFVQLYTYEVRDQNDRKVRQLLNEVLFVLCSKLKPKAFAAHLKRLLPYWFLAMHDVNNEAAAQANKAFEALFPEVQARLEVVDEHLDGMMEEFQSFFGKTVDTFDGIPLETDEREERYERCISAAALSLHTIVNLFADNNHIEKLSDENASFTVAAVITSDKFGKLATATSKHPNFSRDIVRKCVYRALASVVTKAPSIVRVRGEDAFGKIILSILGDKSPGNHEAMWNAVLEFLQAFPSVWKASPSFPKFATSVMVPRLFSQIRHGFHGSARISFPTLLPLLALIPLDAISDRGKGECALYTGVLEQMLKFLDSDGARFNEKYAIHAFFECLTAYFSIFVASDDSTTWLQNEEGDAIVAKYVGQFEKVVKTSLVSVFTTASASPLADVNVELYITSLLTMLARLTSFGTTTVRSDMAVALKNAFLETLHAWIRDVLRTATTKLTLDASKVNLLLSKSLSEATAKSLDAELSAWTLTGTQLYGESLQQLHALVDSSSTTVSSSSVGQLMTLLDGVYRTIGLNAVLETDESADAHFETHIRSVVQAASTWKKLKRFDEQDAAARRATLAVCRHFFIAVAEKKRFLLQLFQDFDVQFGDMVEATAIIQHALEFASTSETSQRWLASGSWTSATDEATGTATSAELQALDAIWKGKLLDEFLMISLKGRLDAMDGDAFTALLRASLGDATTAPVVSPDAVVILGHFALQSNSESPDSQNEWLMRMLPHLLTLFAKIGGACGESGAFPLELATVEHNLYVKLFYLAARGRFREDAAALWKTLALPSMMRWSNDRKQAFARALASELNALLVAPPSATGAAFNSNQLSAFTKSYLLLSGDNKDNNESLFTTQFLAQQLDFLHLRCGDAAALPRFVNRVVQVFGEICEDERVVSRVSAYYAHLYVDNELETVQLMERLVDLDVVHSLTWFVFHNADAADTALQHGDGSDTLLDSRTEIVHHFLTLDALYDALKTTPLLAHVLQHIASPANDKNSSSSKVHHRNLIFANKHSDTLAVDASTLTTPTEDSATVKDPLSAPQRDDLESVVIATLASYVAPSTKASWLQHLVDNHFEWASRDGLALVEPLVVSLIKDNWDEAGERNASQPRAIVATIAAFVDKFAASAQANARYYFQFVRLAGACWRHLGDEARDGELVALFDNLAYKNVLTRMESVLRPGAYASVETSEWILMTEFLSALPTWRVRKTQEDQDKWVAVAKMAITHVIAGKQDVAKATALKLHQRSRVIMAQQDEQQLVLTYPQDVVHGRLAILRLLRAIDQVQANDEGLHSHLAQNGDTLLSIVLCALAEGLELKAHVVSTYVSPTTSARSAYDLIQLSLAVEESLLHVLHSLYVVLPSDLIQSDRMRPLVLESFGGIDRLATLFDAQTYPMHPKLRALLYIVASHSGALRVANSPLQGDAAIDLNADDEAATEAALAKALVPKAVRKALEREFATPHDDVRMTRRKQRPQERDDLLGRLLLWDLFLQLFPAGESHAPAPPAMLASALSSYALRHGLLANFLTFTATLLSQETATSRMSNNKVTLADAPLFQVTDLANGLAQAWTNDKSSVFNVGARVFFRTVTRLPAMVRTWWNDECTRSLRSWAAKYFEDHITPFILSSELDIIQSASQTHSWDVDEMSVKGSRVSREITTTYVKDECALEMVIRVPASYPLRSVEVECTKRIGIAEDRWRRWVLQIIKVTASQDGSLLDAVLLWKQNVDKEFEGVEPCPICYSILNPKTMGLPNLPCKTCSNKYHNSCLYKWFNQSGKNKCPICQQPFH